MTGIEKLILTKLSKGVMFARSFHVAKPTVLSLIQRGYIQRVVGSGGRKNALGITPKGLRAIGLGHTVAAIPAEANDD